MDLGLTSHVLRLYNQFMSGVNENDHLQGYYAMRTKSTKCYKYISWFLIDVSIINRFILYMRVPTVGKKLSLKEFRGELAKQLIGSFNSRKYCGKPSAHQHGSSSREHKMHLPHYPIRASQGRCHHCSSTEGRTSTWYCNECQLHFCHTGNPSSDYFLKHHLYAGL